MTSKHNASIGHSYPAPKYGAGGAVQPTINNLSIDVHTPVNRENVNLTKLKRAITSFESRIPRYRELYEVFAVIDLDPHVSGVWEKRVRPITNANWVFKNEAGEEHKEVTQLIDSIGFEGLLREIMNSKTFNQSWMEPTFWKTPRGTWEMSHNLLNRLNYRPHLGVFANDATTNEGQNIREDKYYRQRVIEVGEAGDLGLYAKIAPYQMLKQGEVGDWAAFLQVFGEGIIDAVWDGFDESQKQKLRDGLQSAGYKRVVVRPAGTEVDIKESSITGNADLFDRFFDNCNREISKCLLSTTETVEASKSSGYAQSKTHAEADGETTEADLTFVRRILNSRFTTILTAAGFNITGYTFELESDDEVLSKETNIDKMIMAFDKKIPINMEHFYAVSGWEPPAWLNEWEEAQKRKLEEPKPEEEEEDELDEETLQKGKKSKKTKPGKQEQVELSWLRKNWVKLSALFTEAPTQIGATVTPTACCETLITLSAEAEPDYNQLEEAVQVAKGQSELYPELFYWNADTFAEAFQAGLLGQEQTPLTKGEPQAVGSTLPLPRGSAEGEGVQLASEFGITYGYNSPAMHTAWEMNLFKFSVIKAAYQSRKVNEIFRRATSFNEFKTLVKKLYGVSNLHHLETEYNTAFQVGQGAALFQRLYNKRNTFPYVEIRTIGDNKVRKAHELLNGLTISIEVIIALNFWTPFDWGCRCYFVPRMASEVDLAKVDRDTAKLKGFLESPIWEKARKNGFARINAVSHEVFTQEQMYSEQPDKVLKKLEQLTAEDWRLAKIAMIQKERQELFTPATDQSVIDTFFEQHQRTDTRLGLNDYAMRFIMMERAALQKIATTGDAYRYLNVLREVIQQADEVWAKPSLNQFTYVKYYRNEAIKVRAKVNSSGDLEILDWAGNISEAERSGLVIRKP